MRKNNGNRNSPKLFMFLSALFFLLWLYPRWRGGDIHDFNVADCMASKIPPLFLIDTFEILYYISTAAVVFLTINILRSENIAKKREELIRSVIMNVSGTFLMMFYYPFLSVIPDINLALCMVTGAFALSAISVEMTKKHRKLTFVKVLNLIFIAYLLYISLIYELIA